MKSGESIGCDLGLTLASLVESQKALHRPLNISAIPSLETLADLHSNSQSANRNGRKSRKRSSKTVDELLTDLNP